MKYRTDSTVSPFAAASFNGERSSVKPNPLSIPSRYSLCVHAEAITLTRRIGRICSSICPAIATTKLPRSVARILRDILATDVIFMFTSRVCAGPSLSNIVTVLLKSPIVAHLSHDMHVNRKFANKV